MSRSGYIDDYDDPLVIGRWRGMVSSAVRGKRGQQFLKDLAVALDEMHEKKLIVKELSKHGIQSILTAPENLTVNTINRYLEIKANQKI